MQQIHPNGLIGTGAPRVDGFLKVTGKARYGADQPALSAPPAPGTAQPMPRSAVSNSGPATPGSRPAHAVLVTSPIARGRITAIDEKAARALAGVCEVLTYRNVGSAIKQGKTLVSGGYLSHPTMPLRTSEIHFAGEIIAVVIADSAAVAQQAADLIAFHFKAEAATVSLDSPGNTEIKAKALGETELSAGHLEQGFAAAVETVDAEYRTPAQHHNPMELFQCTAVWSEDGKLLTVYESCQNVRGFQHGLAQALGIKPAQVRVVSEYIGGAFGSRGEMGNHSALIAFAARRLGRPVKHVATRQQGFTLRTFRAETKHHVRLGADSEGRLTALDHESWELTCRDEAFAVAGSDSTARLYACPNVRTKVHNITADRQAPGFMRAPPETPYLFAMESAMDELACKLGIDPIDLRRRNETSIETVTGKPYTSRSLLQCIDKGAELFGWSKRNPVPRSHAVGNDLVGWGYATAFYPTQMGPAQCTVTLTEDLHARVEVGSHEIGTGIRTVIAQTAADLLGLPLAAVEVLIGDSELPAAPLSAGSNSTATVCSVVAVACESLRHRIARAAIDSKTSPLAGVANDSVRLVNARAVSGSRSEDLTAAIRRAGRRRPLVEKATNTPHGVPPVIGNMLVRKGKPIIKGGAALKDRMQFAFGAHFVEVRIDRSTSQIRVPRMVGVFAAGRIMNRRTAWAQLNGGQIWGMSSALYEATEVDRGTARYVNRDFAEYHVPVCADVGDIQTVMLDEVDHLVNPLGIKGVGELGVTGVNAAIANAVFHATGTRIRTLPIRAGDMSL